MTRSFGPQKANLRIGQQTATVIIVGRGRVRDH